MINEEKRMTEVKAELKKYWNYERNAPLLPEEVKLNSNRVVWWKCLNGHSYKMTVSKRTRRKGCPCCEGNE